MTARRLVLPSLCGRRDLVRCWRLYLTLVARGVLLVLVACSASALEPWGVPDLRQPDKQSHALGGALIGSLTVVALERWAPRMRPWQRVLAGVGAAIVAGTAKEFIDAHTHGDADPKDALATAAGGAAGAIAAEVVFRF